MFAGSGTVNVGNTRGTPPAGTLPALSLGLSEVVGEGSIFVELEQAASSSNSASDNVTINIFHLEFIPVL
jgi:hypothetical protein